MRFFGNKIILFVVILGFVFLWGLWSYTQLPEENIIIDGTKEPEQIPQDSAGGDASVLKSEAVVCNGKTYIFDTIKVGGNYFTKIYENSKSQDGLIVRLRAQRELIHEEKSYTEILAFSVFTTPSVNCNKIYLTNILPVSHPVPAQGIFEWRIGTKEIRELTISKEFAGNYVPYFPEQGHIAPISPGGEKIIIAKQGDLTGENRWCNYKSLHLLDLSEDVSRPLVKLVGAESFDDGTSDLDPYCGGLNFGWLSESEIYYDVYDTTTEDKGKRQLLERRTLVIP